MIRWSVGGELPSLGEVRSARHEFGIAGRIGTSKVLRPGISHAGLAGIVRQVSFCGTGQDDECPECGEPVDWDDENCPDCGAELDEESEACSSTALLTDLAVNLAATGIGAVAAAGARRVRNERRMSKAEADEARVRAALQGAADESPGAPPS
jgi:endogenous inhibitor of DNA gyrase (YacG/DUF329 family)